MQPTYSSYREFRIEVSSTEDGAVWSADLKAASEEEPCRREGKLSSEEWHQFLRDFENAGGWGWLEIEESEKPQPTDQAYYTLDIPAWGSKRVYGRPTEKHDRLVRFIDGSFIGRGSSGPDYLFCFHCSARLFISS